MEREGGLVREDPLLLRPEPDRHHVLVFARREVNDSVNPPARADNPAVPEVLGESCAE